MLLGIILAGVHLLLTEDSACVIAKQVCGSSACLSTTKNTRRVSGSLAHTLGQYDWEVGLQPVCGPTSAFINEREQSVLCFCAYE